MVVLSIVLSGCSDDYPIIKSREEGLGMSFNGKTYGGITALCDSNYKENVFKIKNVSTARSDDFNNYEFLGYFYSDLFNITRNSYLSNDKGNVYALNPHFISSSKISCSTFDGTSYLMVHFFFVEDASKQDRADVLNMVKTKLQDRWYIKNVGILGKYEPLDP